MKELTDEQVVGMILLAKGEIDIEKDLTTADIITLCRAFHLQGQKDVELPAVPEIPSERFMAACAAMQGLAANQYSPNYDDKQLAKYSVIYADALIAELNRTAEKGGEGCE